MTRSHPRRRLGVVLIAAISIVVSGCSLAGSTPPLAELAPLDAALSAIGGAAEQQPDPARTTPKRKLKPYTLDLYQPGDHVAQYDGSWCVGASMQMMINLMDDGRPDRTRETQQRLYKLARRTSPWVETRPGASVYGWAEGLEGLGFGGFEELAAGTRQGALKLAARQMRETGRPVGLLVWAGAHAWVMSGFKATADPALTDDFRVTHVWIEDPWAGRVSRTWGPGLEPHTLLTAEELGRDYVKYASFYRPQYGKDGKYVVVAPVEELSAPI